MSFFKRLFGGKRRKHAGLPDLSQIKESLLKPKISVFQLDSLDPVAEQVKVDVQGFKKLVTKLKNDQGYNAAMERMLEF